MSIHLKQQQQSPKHATVQVLPKVWCLQAQSCFNLVYTSWEHTVKLTPGPLAEPPPKPSTPVSPVTWPQIRCSCCFLFWYTVSCSQIFFLFIQTGLVQGPFSSVAFSGFPKRSSFANFPIAILTSFTLLYICFLRLCKVYMLFGGKDHVGSIPVSKAPIIAPRPVEMAQ